MSDNFRAGLTGREEENLMSLNDAESLLQYFVTTERKHNRSEAERLFFMGEVQFLGGVKNALVNGRDGIPEDMLVGKWKHHDRIYVRAGKRGSLAMLADYHLMVDIRTDCKERAFLDGANFSHLSLERVNEYLPVINSIVKAVAGYENVVAARRFGRKEE